ncbi:MAG TPA: hypothetical protein VFQ45_23685 [Longimicrobium sp.]|nr:hypothetical protein [Longimicrobium sp.]
MLSFTHLLARFDGTGAVRTFVELPAACPVCARHTEPRRLSAHATQPGDESVDFAFQCARPECRHVFVAEYRRTGGGDYELLHDAPLTLREAAILAPCG